MNPFLITSIISIICIICSSLHLIHTADTVAAITGNLVSVVFLPFVIGLVIGFIGINFVEKGTIKKLWWIPSISAFITLLPITYTYIIMSYFGH